MATNNRQNTLLANTVWQKIYRTFSQADFKSYDFDTIRRTLIDYLQLNYPESFNDFIESSEYVALIDMIAYIAQSISYRVDLNSRENFIDLAERKESVLRLARLISYQPKRNIAGSGFLKINAITTTESVLDSNGQNLANTPILWNDLTNDSWQDQFNAVFNAALPKSQFVNKPEISATIAGVPTQLYRINGANFNLPLYPFNKSINGVNMDFEVVPCTFANESFVYEESPVLGNSLSILYKNDSKGFGSNNTGYFLHFKQGTLNSQDFSITNTAPNTIVSINENNINNDDVFLFKLDQNGVVEQKWTKVPAVIGNNVIYNNLQKSQTEQFAVVSKSNDQVDLVFSDGVYGTLPQGNFRCYFRQSNGLTYQINKSDLQNINIAVDYVSKGGQVNTITLNCSIKSNISNASRSQTISEIKTLAPQSYYTNNRMISAEDYQIVPLTQNPSIVKAKSQVRTASGISRFLDITDPTGVYSQTDIVADDGMLYLEEDTETFDFQFTIDTDIENIINTELTDVLQSASLKQYYYKNFPRISVSDKTWNKSTQTVNKVTGYIKDTGPLSVGKFTSSNLLYVRPNSMLKFTAPSGYHFMTQNGTLMAGSAGHPGSADTIWCKVVSVEADGSNGGQGNLSDGTGPIVLNDLVPSTAELGEIIPSFITTVNQTLKTSIIDKVKNYTNFGLGYDTQNEVWYVIDQDNINTGSFSLNNAKDTTDSNLDASWLIRFETNGVSYTVYNRATRYVFESYSRNKFYFDESVKINDPETGFSIKDKIRILKSNTQADFVSNLTFDYDWQIEKNILSTDGYNDTRKMQVGFFDSDDDGVVDNPDIFDLVVDPTSNVTQKYVFFKTSTENGYAELNPVQQTSFVVVAEENDITQPSTYPDGQLFYFYTPNTFATYDADQDLLVTTTGYTAKLGRQDLLYNYNHGAPRNRRIDPSVSNIVDVYVITRSYNEAIREWLRNNQTTSKPQAPTIFELENDYLGSLDQLKSVSDEIIFNPGKFKLLFGPGANSKLQATFKIVKNQNSVISDSQIKSDVIDAIDNFFSLDFWDFGENFYFTELAAYIHNQTAPDVSSVVIVPAESGNAFGSLFQVYAEDNEIFVSSATVDNVEIITSISAESIKATGNVVSSSTTTTSTTGTVASSITTTTGGSSGGYY